MTASWKKLSKLRQDDGGHGYGPWALVNPQQSAYGVPLAENPEKVRRRARYEQRLGAVHKRPNLKDRKREAQQSNTRRGNKQAWMKDQAS